MRLTSKVFWDLAILMGGFGLVAGLLFPPFVTLLGMPADRAFSARFYGATIVAGLAVAGANFLLARALVGGRLHSVAERMRSVEYSLDESVDELERHRLAVDSTDEIGDCARSFNSLLVALERSRAAERRLSRTDELTGLANRRHGLAVLSDALGAAAGNQVGLLLLDVDEFKEINDRYGHLAGDTALRRVADDVRQSVRGGDIVSRYGGDELMVVLPGCPNETLAAVGERLRGRIASRTLVFEGQSFGLTVSVGGAGTLGEGEDAAMDLIARADGALYDSKAHGRNRLTLVA
jgi:diguanylate cyclase (GGDEF)-like protein